jgi:hypothetical protein
VDHLNIPLRFRILENPEISGVPGQVTEMEDLEQIIEESLNIMDTSSTMAPPPSPELITLPDVPLPEETLPPADSISQPPPPF